MGLNSIDSPIRVLVVADYAVVPDGLADFLESAHFDVAVAYLDVPSIVVWSSPPFLRPRAWRGGPRRDRLAASFRNAR